MKLLIDNGKGFQDYTRYCVDGSLSVEDSVNVPTVANFVLAASDNTFQVPKRGAYVKIVSEQYPATTTQAGQAYQFGPATAYFFLQNGSGEFADVYPTLSLNEAVAVGQNSNSMNIQNFLGNVSWQTPTGSKDITTGLDEFRCVMLADLYVSAAGTYTINVNHWDGVQFAIQGATLVSGPAGTNNAIRTAIQGYFFENGGTTGTNINLGSPGITETYQIGFPQQGVYSMEVDWSSQDNLLRLGQLNVTAASGSFIPTFSERVLFTGFISDEPGRTFLGLNKSLSNFGFQQLSYSINCTSDEWLLNVRAVPYIPAFINQTAGQILGQIADVLAPGFLNVGNNTLSGDLIPFYQYSSDQTWSDIAKYFGDALRCRYKVLDKVLYFEPFDNTPLGVAYDETTGEKNFFPLELTTQIVSVPPVNDCLVLGGTEPQANWENYFIGDGVTSQFRLLHEVFQGATALLLEDDWTESEFQSNLWTVFEHGVPIFGNGTIFSLFDQTTGQTAGSLLVDSQADVSTLGQSFIVGVNGVELGGALNAQHGEFLFTDTCYGIVGGLYFNENTVEANCWAGFQLTTSGANLGQLLSVTHPEQVTASGAGGIIIQPLYLGAPVGTQVVSQPNHTYLLQTWVGASQWNRYENVYRNLTGDISYGGNFLTASGTVTWVITDNNLGAYAALPVGTTPVQADELVKPVVTKYTIQQQNPPEFAAYSPVNVEQCNFSLQNTILANPPEGSLYVFALTGASGLQLPVLPQDLGTEEHCLMGFGQQNQTATVLAQSDTQFLAFYNDSIPGVGSRIRYQSWAAGQASARVIDPIAIANEASVSGDSGVRSAIMQNLQPLPRTSSECQLAAAAAIHDREYPQWQGTYTVETIPNKYVNLFNPGVYDYPRAGELLYINSPFRAISGELFVTNTIRIQVTELREEVLQIAVDYGPDLYLERTLSNFVQRLDLTTQVLTPQETAPPPDLIHIDQVGNAFLDDLQDARITVIANSVSGNTISIDLGVTPVTGCEIRRADFNWGVPDVNQIGVVTTETFSLTRSSRDQTWYLRQVDGTTFSEFSKALRVVYPFIPSAPVVLANNATTITFALAGFVDDIYGLEIRAPGLTGIGVDFANEPADFISCFSRVPLPATPQTGNAFAVYNPPTSNTPFTVQTGDVMFFFCRQDRSFTGARLITSTGTGGGAPPTMISPTIFTPLNGGFTNPGNAADGNLNTFSPGTVGPGGGGGIVGETWSGFPAGSYPNPLIVFMKSSAGCVSSGEASASWKDGDTGGGSLWEISAGAFQNNSRGPTVDQATLPSGVDVTKVSVNVTLFSVGKEPDNPPGHIFSSVYEIWIASGTSSPSYNYFSWYDNGFPQDTVGILGQPYNNGILGEAALVVRGPTHTVTNGSIDSLGVATITTGTNHGYNVGDTVIMSCGYTSWPGGAWGPTPTDGAVFSPRASQPYATVRSVPAANQFTYFVINNPFASLGGLPSVTLSGLVAKIPIVGSGGVILQRPIFSPSDLIVDLTEPDIANELLLLQALSPSGARVTELDAYFFNLMWDYSAPTTLSALFAAPALSGGKIEARMKTLSWGISQGTPSGYRTVMVNNYFGNIQNKFTVNHPYNPQLLTQFQMTDLDFNSPLTIQVTPFDALGDGETMTLSWDGSGSGGGGGPASNAIQIITDPPMYGGDFNTFFELGATNFVGDTGAGGVAGWVPAPPAGSAAANEYLSASGFFAPIVNQPYDVTFGVAGKPPANIVLPIETFPRVVTFPGNFNGSQGSDGINPTGTPVYTIKKNGTTVGTISVSTGGVFTFTSTGGAQVQFNIGDRLTVITPNPQDATLSDATVTFAGIRQ